jgi:hypothetical protein
VNREVYLTDFSILLPGINDLESLIGAFTGTFTPPIMERQILSNGQYAEFGKPDIVKDSEYYPHRQDLKIMRKDVLAATICACKLMKKMQLPSDKVPYIPFYMSSGAFVENLFSQSARTTDSINKAFDISDTARINEMLYKAIPPLLALNTLTNAASSYVAQYSKLAGRNATFGNTSAGSAYALHSAFNEIRNGDSDLAVAGASNIGELYSYLSLNQFSEMSEGWRESAGAALLILSEKKFLEENSVQPLCIIEFVKFSNSIPRLAARTDYQNSEFQNVIAGGKIVVFSGAYTADSYAQQLNLFKTMIPFAFSWFPVLGNAGPVNNILNLLTGIILMKNRNADSVFCIDKDPYGRESLIKINSVGQSSLQKK